MLVTAQYALYDALVSINVPAEKARAVAESLEQDMSTILATKTDLGTTQLLLKQEIGTVRSLRQEMASRDSLRQEMGAMRDSLRQEIEANRVLLEHKLELLRSSMTIRLGSMQIVGMGLLFAALKLT
jgi:transposase-like protein